MSAATTHKLDLSAVHSDVGSNSDTNLIHLRFGLTDARLSHHYAVSCRQSIEQALFLRRSASFFSGIIVHYSCVLPHAD